MNKSILVVIYFFCFLHSSAKANEDLIQLLSLAVEIEDANLIKDSINAVLESENYNTILFDSLRKYSVGGSLQFVLHRAVYDKNILASIVLANHSKNVNTLYEHESAWIQTNSGISNQPKIPIEIALESNLKEIIPFLLRKGADLYRFREVNFIWDEKENLDYITELGFTAEKKVCVKSKRAFYPISPLRMSRTFIGDAIVQNRLDILQLLYKLHPIDFNRPCCKLMSTNRILTPLQFSLAIKRYDISMFLIDLEVSVECN